MERSGTTVNLQAKRPQVESDVDVLKRLALDRFTCRAYRPDPVPEAVIREIIEVSRQTASWCNVQPWQVVITSRESTEKFREALTEQARRFPGVDSDLEFPPEYRGIYKERRRETGYMLYAALGIERSDWERRQRQGFENFRMFGAPHVAIVTTPGEIGPYALVDCGAFIGTFLLAARAQGVATTPQAALARHSKFIRSCFGIGDEQKVVCGIAFGYADVEHPANSFRTTRAAPDELMRIV
jgi:nitroreductase